MQPAPDATQLTQALEALLPEETVAYAEVVGQALHAFFVALPAARQIEILSRQQSLGAAANEMARLRVFLTCCPTLHKLGQILARDRRLGPGLRALLQTLETLEPRKIEGEWSRHLTTALEEQLGLPCKLDDLTLGEGSVAAVIPVTIGHDSAGARSAVLKVLKPGVRERIAQELAIWPRVTNQVDEGCRRRALAMPGLEPLVPQVESLLERELDLASEAVNLAAAGRELEKDLDEVVVPEVFCEDLVIPQLPDPTVEGVSPSDGAQAGGEAAVLMERLDGEPLGRVLSGASEPRASSGVEADRAKTLFEVLIGKPLLRPAGAALFHGDPHAGNFLVCSDGRLGLLDWSQAGSLNKEDRVQIVKAVVAGLTLDGSRLRSALTALAESVPDPEVLRRSVEESLREVRSGRVPGIQWFVALLDSSATDGGVRYPSDLLLLRKSWLTLSGVLHDLDPGFSEDLALLRAVTAQAVREWPLRYFSTPRDRGFGVHLSNLDLMRLGLSGPSTTARFWWQTVRDARKSS